MRRANGEIGVGNSSALDTISAAATAIASAETRMRQSSVQKRRWGGWWSIYSCFGSRRQSKRIGHANISPERTSYSRVEFPSSENQAQTPSSNISHPFIAPPSSPASSLYSELPSAAQSPAPSLSFTSIAANMYSPSGPASMFSIGPYAHETQLVSPPVFSTFTTEPSTAPFTPPPESVHMTTPSSPEVPFARLLDPTHQNGEPIQRFPFSHYEFQSYQLYPGSPVGHLISPSSGTSSPFEHPLFFSGTPNPRSRDSVVLDRQHSDIGPLTNSFSGWRNDQPGADHRVSFEITAEEVVRCVEKKSRAMNICNYSGGEMVNEEDGHRHRHRKQQSITLGPIREFNFDNMDGTNFNKPNTSTDWWANEKEAPPSRNWSFFPMIQPSVS